MHSDVTVLMPVKNEERHIGRALRCLERQTVDRYEALVIDDGSTDGTPQILSEFAARDGRVRIITTEGIGLNASLNLGVSECRTELIARLDADDISLKRRLARQLTEFARNPDAVAIGTYGYRVNELGVPVGRLATGPTDPQDFHHWRTRGKEINLTHSSAMYRRSAVEQVGGYPRDYPAAMDLALWNRLADVGEIYALPDALTIYTIRKASVSSANLMLQELAAARIRAEIKLHRRFSSFDEFRRYMEINDRDWDAKQRALQRTAERRNFGRSLAGGQFLNAWRIMRRSESGRQMITKTLRRAAHG